MFDMERVDLGDDNHWMIGNYELLISQGNIKGMKPKQIGKLVIAMMDLIDEKREREIAKELEWRRQPGLGRYNGQVPNRKAVYRALVERDGERCNLTGCDRMPLEIDHICPISKGGGHDLDNLQLLCKRHNAAKRDENWEVFLERYMNHE
jgi:hypothetical protein